MVWKRLIVLANSYKAGGRCVAGREIRERDYAGWLRPLSDRPQGELHDPHMRLADGGALNVLDVVDVPLDRYVDDWVHPEDWRIALGTPWRRRGRFPPEQLAALVESPPDLWLDRSEMFADRATTAALVGRPAHQSLYLVRPTSFRIEFTNEFNRFLNRHKRERRARFHCGGRDYALSITDPLFIREHPANFPAPGAPANTLRPPCGDNCLLCVSLTPAFNGYHYKVVATVLEPR